MAITEDAMQGRVSGADDVMTAIRRAATRPQSGGAVDLVRKSLAEVGVLAGERTEWEAFDRLPRVEERPDRADDRAFSRPR